MANNTPLHLLTEALVRELSDAEIASRLRAYEGFDDPDETETPAGVTLLYKERDRRAADETFSGTCPTCGQEDARRTAPWFLVTARPRSYAPVQLFLMQARAGAEIEDALRTYGIDGPEWGVSWDQVGNLRYGVVDCGRLTVIPAVPR